MHLGGMGNHLAGYVQMEHVMPPAQKRVFVSMVNPHAAMVYVFKKKSFILKFDLIYVVR